MLALHNRRTAPDARAHERDPLGRVLTSNYGSPARAATLEGVVKTSAGQPVDGAMVTVFSANRMRKQTVFTKDGKVCSSSSNLPAYAIEDGVPSFICIDPAGADKDRATLNRYPRIADADAGADTGADTGN